MHGSENYFVLTGTGAVTLSGLLFVVIALAADRIQHGDERLLRIFLTPPLVHFSVVLLIALLALSPEGDSLLLPFGLVGIIGLVYSLYIAVKAARDEGVLTDAWLFHGGLPIVCYVGIIVAACAGLTSIKLAYTILRAISALLLLAGIRNAWTAAFDVARRQAK